LDNGLTLVVQAGTRSDMPIIIDRPIEKIIVECGAHAVVHWSKSSGEQHNYLICYVHDNAELSFVYENHNVVLEAPTELAFHLGVASVLNCAIAITQGQSVLDISVMLSGRNGRAIITGVYVVTDNDQLKVRTVQHHGAPDTVSSVLLKGIAGGKASAHYRGTIRVDDEGQRSCAAQHNKNLLLSADARVEAEPCLEVLTNNVSCAHGSASGPVDVQALWYLQTRGITKQQAELMLIQTFLDEVIVQMPDTFKNKVRGAIKELYG